MRPGAGPLGCTDPVDWPQVAGEEAEEAEEAGEVLARRRRRSGRLRQQVTCCCRCDEGQGP